MRVFLFHRDLRLTDNTTLIKMCKENEEKIVCIFIFTEQQINPKKNKFYGSNAVQFMIESLVSLDKEIRNFGGKLYFFRDTDTVSALEKIHKKIKITEFGSNPDYTPFALKRDRQVHQFCKKNNITIYYEEDTPLFNLFDSSTLKENGEPYKVFTPFRNNLWNKEIRPVDKWNKFNFRKESELTFKVKLDELYTENKTLLVRGGRENAMKLLGKIKEQKIYGKCRDFLTYKTTFLGAYITFGVISCREVLFKVRKELGKHTTLESELFWNLFYQMITYRFPHVIKSTFKADWQDIKYKNNARYIKAILEAKTGFPVIDAGLRQLYTTGYCHNRLRMVITSFMGKNLMLDPKWIEKFWANYLVDYNVCQTNGGVSWVLGYGTDAMMYNRIFNPWTQSLKFDKNAEFIKKWIPELKDVEPKKIHNWEIHYDSIFFVKPIVSHKDTRQDYLKFLKKNKLT